MNERREDLLISRAIDGEASNDEWRELENFAQADPTLWRQLAQGQRDHADLMRTMSSASAIADAVSLPSLSRRENVRQSAAPMRLNRLGAWSGWAVAATVAIVAWGRWFDPVNGPSHPVQPASFGSAAQAFQAYLDRGRESGEVVGEMPTKVLLETRPIISGDGFEVLYLRQVMERTVVPTLYQVSGEDEAGRPTLARYEFPVRSSL